MVVVHRNERGTVRVMDLTAEETLRFLIRADDRMARRAAGLPPRELTDAEVDRRIFEMALRLEC